MIVYLLFIPARFEMKGFCKEETELMGNFDTRFYVDGHRNGKMFIR